MVVKSEKLSTQIEPIQKRATKTILSDNLFYELRLKKLNLITLAEKEPSYVTYCSNQLLKTKTKTASNRLQKLQNRAARVVLSMSNDTPGFEALGMLAWESLETRRAKAKTVYRYKVLNGLAPSSLNDLFVSKSDITEYDLRSSHTSLQLPQKFPYLSATASN